MQTKYSSNKTQSIPLDPPKDFTRAPQPIDAKAYDYPPGHLVPFHQHEQLQLLYASSGVMTVTTDIGIWVVPPGEHWHGIFVQRRG
jgi:hypothetical protein